MNKNIIIILLFFIGISFAKSKLPSAKSISKDWKYRDLKDQYCDLRKNFVIAISDVNDFSERDKKSISKGRHQDLGKYIVVDPGDTDWSKQETLSGRGSDREIENKKNEINNLNKNYVIITNPGDSNFDRNSRVTQDEYRRVNAELKESGSRPAESRQFKYAVVKSSMEELVRSSLETGLNASNQFSVVDRSSMSSIMDEMGMQYSGLVDPSSQKELGQMLGADLICLADIKSYSERNGKDETKITIVVNLKFTNVETGEIFEQFELKVKKEKKGKNKFDKTRGDLMTKLGKSIAKELKKLSGSMSWDAKAKIKRGNIYVVAGADDGVQTNMVFDLYISGEEEWDDDLEMMMGTEEYVGEVYVNNNAVGKGVKAGRLSTCEILDSSLRLDSELQYTVRVPNIIKEKLNCTY